MERAFYDHEPATIEAVGNGSYMYRWDIQKESQSMPAMIVGESVDEITQYSCYEVTVWPPLSANNITKAAIGQMWEASYEQKLVNEFNAANLGLYGPLDTSDEAVTKIAAYRDFLHERVALKAQIDTDMAKLKLPF